MLFAESFPPDGPCQFRSEEEQMAEGVATVTATFRVLDEGRWMAVLPVLLEDGAAYESDFSWVVRKEFYFDTTAKGVRYLWTVFAWARDDVGLRLAARVWRLHVGALPPTPRQTAQPKRAAPAAKKAAAEDEDDSAESGRLRPSVRNTTVHGREKDGTVKSSTKIQLGRRVGKPLYVVEDPRKRSVVATRPGSGELSGATAREGISGKPRVHVTGCEEYEGGSAAFVEDL